VATIVGVLGGQFIPDPRVLGLDVVFPAAMAGLAVGLSNGRREVVAATVGVICAVVIGLLWDSRVGIVVGGVIGPLAGLAVPRALDASPLGDIVEDLDGGMPS
jgi:predicted branched-subunit amino acid permease